MCNGHNELACLNMYVLSLNLKSGRLSVFQVGNWKPMELMKSRTDVVFKVGRRFS